MSTVNPPFSINFILYNKYNKNHFQIDIINKTYYYLLNIIKFNFLYIFYIYKNLLKVFKIADIRVSIIADVPVSKFQFRSLQFNLSINTKTHFYTSNTYSIAFK